MFAERINRIIKSSIARDLSWAFTAQIIGNILRFLLIFVVIRCYTKEEFGLWSSITSLAAVIVTGDFGLTNVLRNIASNGITKGAEGDNFTKESWMSAVVFLFAISLVGIVVLYMLKDTTVFESLFKTNDARIKEIGNNVVFMVIGVFLVNLPFTLTGGLFLSYGEVKESSIFSLLSGVLTFLVVAVLSFYHCRIDVVSISFFVCPLVISFLSTLYFVKRRKWKKFHCKPKTICIHIKEMLPAGAEFVGIGFFSHLIPNSLTIFSGALLGLSAAASINVSQKIFSFFSSILVGLLNPIWARLSRSFYNGKYDICRNLLSISTLSMITISVFIILISTLINDILVFVIAGPGYDADAYIFLLVGFCLFGKAIHDNVSLLLYATNKLLL